MSDFPEALNKVLPDYCRCIPRCSHLDPEQHDRMCPKYVRPAVLAAHQQATEALRARLTKTADYLDALEASLLRNDADMMLDGCEAPSSIAQEIRAALSNTGGGDEAE